VLSSDKLRSEVCSALWTLVKAWDAAGRPGPTSRMPKCPEWSEIIGAIVEHAGFGNPCAKPEIASSGGDVRDMQKLICARATELDRSNFGEYVWKRLRIIASEDIGLAQPSAVVSIRALYDNWKDQRKKDDARHAPERLFLVHAVMLLCRAAKSRSVDHALVVFYEGERPRREVPDFALDKHTGRGRARKRGGTTGGPKAASSRPPSPNTTKPKPAPSAAKHKQKWTSRPMNSEPLEELLLCFGFRLKGRMFLFWP